MREHKHGVFQNHYSIQEPVFDLYTKVHSRIYHTREQGNTDASHTCITYTVIDGILFETYTILHLPVFSPNTGKYVTRNACNSRQFFAVKQYIGSSK